MNVTSAELRAEALRLYRHYLKSLSFLPASHSNVFKRKLAYNFREIFEIHRREQDEEKIKGLISDGWADVETFRELFSLEPGLLCQLFPLFDAAKGSERNCPENIAA